MQNKVDKWSYSWYYSQVVIVLETISNTVGMA